MLQRNALHSPCKVLLLSVASFHDLNRALYDCINCHLLFLPLPLAAQPPTIKTHPFILVIFLVFTSGKFSWGRSTLQRLQFTDSQVSPQERGFSAHSVSCLLELIMISVCLKRNLAVKFGIQSHLFRAVGKEGKSLRSHFGHKFSSK